MKPILAICLGISLGFLSGCTSIALQTADGKNTVTDSNPMDSVVALSSGPGCTVPDPYVPPAAPAPKLVMSRQLCDNTGHNCQAMLIPVSPAEDPTRCDVTVAQTKGLGFAPYLAVGASIFAMIGLALGGF